MGEERAPQARPRANREFTERDVGSCEFTVAAASNAVLTDASFGAIFATAASTRAARRDRCSMNLTVYAVVAVGPAPQNHGAHRCGQSLQE